ncbi:M28 family peptidase [Changchengzhania lutea]|uniref:M28 family peptidase n=1 Tax=Changchengzhania lutea TaxID=2049305 RepID=UPI00115F125F|nr:M28 family peptidase [Changchengzhania lutea]
MTKQLYLIALLLFINITIVKAQAQYIHAAHPDPKAQDVLFNSENLLCHVKNLSSDAFEGRRTGTKGGIKAKNYVIHQYQKLKISPYKKSYQQPFYFYKGGKSYSGINVLGFIKGTKNTREFIVISAHYDHEGIKKGQIYNGADDNASGVSALFSIAEYLKNHPPKTSVILAAFDGEELGLRGAKHFVDSNIISTKSIKANINLDMISRSCKNELFAVGTAYNKRLKCIVTKSEHSKKIKLIAGHDGYDGLQNWTYSSDQAPFHQAGIPFLYFGVADHKDYHEPTDDYEGIQPEFYIEAVKTIISVFNKVDIARL